MSYRVLLDTGVLGMVVHKSSVAERGECKLWLRGLLEAGTAVFVPEIADYELRRELIRGGLNIGRLDSLKVAAGYLALSTETMLLAAELWAQVRNSGKMTADPKELDGDVILAAQAAILPPSSDKTIIATTNVAHLSLLADARLWRDIN